MNKNTKTHTTQVSTTRRKVLKKLSYSPPLLMCLGALTKPRMAGASHGGMPLSNADWQTMTPEGIFATRRLLGLVPGTPQDNGDLLSRDYIAYRAAYNAEHN